MTKSFSLSLSSCLQLDGLQVTPPVNLAEGINIQLSGPNVVVSTTFGLKVSFDGNHRLEIVVPPAYFNTTQGLCGNFNADDTDDMRMPDGNMAATAVDFGNSWKTNTRWVSRSSLGALDVFETRPMFRIALLTQPDRTAAWIERRWACFPFVDLVTIVLQLP